MINEENKPKLIVINKKNTEEIFGKLPQGYFVVIEGIDGAGKSTVVPKVVETLLTEGIKAIATREPTGSMIGRVLREYLSIDHGMAAVDTLLFAADRIEHCVKFIKPNLDAGYIVISDRYKESSLVYQSVKDPDVDEDWIESVNIHAIEPDLVIVIDCEPFVAMERIKQSRGGKLEKFETLSYLHRLRRRYGEVLPSAVWVNGNRSVEYVVRNIIRHILRNRNKKFGITT